MSEETETELKDTTPKYPGEGAALRVIWETCDKLHGEGTAPTYKVVKPLIPEESELADSTIRTQIQRWRMHMGLVNPRGPREKTEEEPAQEETAAA